MTKPVKPSAPPRHDGPAVRHQTFTHHQRTQAPFGVLGHVTSVFPFGDLLLEKSFLHPAR